MLVTVFAPDVGDLSGDLSLKLYPYNPGNLLDESTLTIVNDVYLQADVDNSLTGIKRAVILLDDDPILDGFIDLSLANPTFSTIVETSKGVGSIEHTITILDVNDNPIDSCEVWVTSDSDGDTLVAGTLLTNVNGQVKFFLDPGSYYVWRKKAGFNFTNPQAKVVP